MIVTNRPGTRSGGLITRAKIRPGFTLIELSVVIAIIGIILGFVFMALMEATNSANVRATQALITKLDGGLSDRLEALLETRPDYNNNHLALAGVYNSNYFPNNNFPNRGIMAGVQRAQVIAWYDYVKAEMPDVFVCSNLDANYPLNFAGNPFPTTVNTSLPFPYVLPLGQGDGPTVNPLLTTAGTGVYGASYTAAAGIYKNIKAGGISYLPQGYDGVDNSPLGSAGSGLIDEIGEGIPNPADQQTFISALQHNHLHSTARSEMLYALLVEGRGPLGSVFSADDFTSREVQDTDGDGLPEFIDAWGKPLQFYRWPLLYHSDIQRGLAVADSGGQSWQINAPYDTVYENREQDPLDPDQQLMAPAWWTAAFNNSTPYTLAPTAAYSAPQPSGAATTFEFFFHRLTEPVPTGVGEPGLFWDRAQGGFRRAFYSKFLVVSGGPDQLVGIFRYPDLPSAPPTATQLIANENNAMPFSIAEVDFTAHATIQATALPILIPTAPSVDPTQPSNSDLIQAAQDDIGNHNLSYTNNLGGSGGG
jgi:prepilin-type N-terminal cleavage/methylation domain-containing protein